MYLHKLHEMVMNALAEPVKRMFATVKSALTAANFEMRR